MGKNKQSVTITRYTPKPGVAAQGVNHGGVDVDAVTMSQSTEIMVNSKQSDADDKSMVGFSQIFRFADWKDWLLILGGSLASILHGAGIVLVVVVFGDMIDAFIGSSKIDSQLEKLNITSYNLTKDIVIKNPELIDPIANMTNSTFNSQALITLLEGGLLEQMKKFSVWFCVIGGGVLICAYAQIAFFVLSAERQVRRIRTLFFRAILRQEIGWYDRLGSGELNTRLSDDMSKIAEGIGDKLGVFVQMIVAFITGFVVGFIYGWKLTLVIMAICPAIVLASIIMSKVNSTLTQKELKAYARAGKVAEEVLGSMRTVAAFGGEQKEAARYNKNLFAARDKGVRKGLILGMGMGFSWLVVYSVYALGFWYGAKLIREEPESYTPGVLLIVFFCVVTGAFAIGNSAPNLQSLATARGAAHQIFKIIDQVPLIDSSSEAGLKPSEVVGNIEFRNVFFRYPTRPDVPVLCGLNLTVKVGQTVALVGSSGCGKSTTVQLLQRFYDPLGGIITVDGNDLRDLNLKWLRQNIGIVSQEPILFATTIAENIRYGRDGVTQAEIEEAAKEANAHDFIMKLPEKYETLVGERGAQLSGGQKQRVAIARALVRNPRILLLDEATSALDTESERTVQAALDKARMGRTTIVIAHRLSTIRNADLICGFQGGVVVEKGSHDELMQEHGIYHQLVTLQTRVDDAVDEDEDEKIEEKIELEASGSPKHEEAISQSPDLEDVRLSRGSITDSIRGSLRGLRRISSGIRGVGGRVRSNSGWEESEMMTPAEGDELPPPEMKRIMRLNAPEWPYILFGCLAALINGGEQPVFAVVFSELLGVFTLDDLEKQERDALFYALIFVGIGVIICITMFLQGYMFGKSGEYLTMRIRKLAFKAMLRQEISWYDDHRNNTGALTTRLATDASSVQGATGARLGMIVQNLANIGTGIVIAFIFGWKLALVVLAFLPVIAVAGAVEMRVLSGVANKDKKALEKAGKVALEAIENIRTVASLTKEHTFYLMYDEKLEVPYKGAIKKAHVFGIAFSFSQAVIYFAYAAAFTFGAYLIEQGEMTFANVFKVFAAIVFGAMALGQATSFAPDYSKAKIAASRIFKLLDRQPAIDSSATSGATPKYCTGAVEFKEVRFRYPTRPDVRILRGLNLSVNPGQTLALVGSSGCGKSTTVQLIERFYDALAGHVHIDENDIKKLNIQWIRSQIGIVSQEPVLFDATIAENIAYGDNSRTVPLDEVIEAARNSNIHNFIQTLPLGYDTNVGDKGTQLSGGQKQRVAIARALIRNPKILLLDEATSALDTESEKVVQEALDKARSGRTCIVIAHRLSTIQDADKIAVFHNGRVMELGTHSELMALEGIYYNLQTVQSRTK